MSFTLRQVEFECASTLRALHSGILQFSSDQETETANQNRTSFDSAGASTRKPVGRCDSSIRSSFGDATSYSTGRSARLAKFRPRGCWLSTANVRTYGSSSSSKATGSCRLSSGRGFCTIFSDVARLERERGIFSLLDRRQENFWKDSWDTWKF